MNQKSIFLLFVFCLLFISNLSAQKIFPEKNLLTHDKIEYYKDSKPWSRWWWFADVIKEESIIDNLLWLKKNGFGGVEIAWVYPLNRMLKDTINYTPRQEWLSSEWSYIVAFTKKCADSYELGCDFTFGTLWPFGDSYVPLEESTMFLDDKNRKQEITASWEYPKKGFVIDHLNKKALYNYSLRIGNALKPALSGSVSALFCDSWEVETKFLTTHNFEDTFFLKYGYYLSDYKDNLYSNSEPYRSVRYDYMKLLSEYVLEEFYKPFTEISHNLGAFSRVQCSGAPCDIISAYSVVDVPESEALLFEPTFSNIVSSAANLSGKQIITAETFTCIYGWPRIRICEEQTADLKLLADALFANGVNQIIWHGKPFNSVGSDSTKFYASVHVGSSGSLADEIPAFNNYMQRVSSYLKKGIAFSDIAVYLPTEDSWVAGELPKEKQFIWAWGEYEQRYTYFPEELKGFCPMWINGDFLEKAKYENGFLKVGDCAFKALYLDIKWMDIKYLRTIVKLAKAGLPIIVKQIPEEPGLNKNISEYKYLCFELMEYDNVRINTEKFLHLKPLISGFNLPDFKCRQTENELYIFFANPKSKGLKFPLEYGQSFNIQVVNIDIIISFGKFCIPYKLVFEPYQSKLLKINNKGVITDIDISFIPKKPVFIPREKPEKEKWEVY